MYSLFMGYLPSSLASQSKHNMLGHSANLLWGKSERKTAMTSRAFRNGCNRVAEEGRVRVRVRVRVRREEERLSSRTNPEWTS